MTDLSPQLERRLRQGFKGFVNPFMLALWRLGLGPWVNLWPTVGGRIMVLVHTGRKSGQRRFTPVNYARQGQAVYCVAGFGAAAHWYRNLLAEPRVEVWLPDGWWAGRADDISASADRLPLLRTVLIASGFAAYAAGVDPRRMSDAELDAATAPYRLLRIELTAARTGPGGPGEFAWIWPLATFLLLLRLSRRPARR